MEKKVRRIGVLTSGGDAPGMNAAVRAVVRASIARGIGCIGIRRGWNGLITSDFVPLTSSSVSHIINKGGTMLYTARSLEFMEESGRAKALATCRLLGLDGIVAIGGDGTFRGALAISRQAAQDNMSVRVVGIPATIDNDIGCSHYTIGFDSACNTAIECIDKLRDTMQSHERCSVVEVMGRHAGYLALYVGISVGATAVLIPEREPDFERDIVEKIRRARLAGTTHYMVVVAEGAGIGSVVRSRDGMLWLSVAKNKQGTGATLPYIVRLDPSTLETTVIPVPEDMYPPANSWYAWTPDAFVASTVQNCLYWKGGPNRWFCGTQIYKYDIDTSTLSLFIDLDAEGANWKLYGCSLGVHPVTDELYMSLYHEFGTPTYITRRYGPDGRAIRDYDMIRNYWFPSLPLFPEGQEQSGITDAAADSDADAPVEFYNLQGMRVDGMSLAPGVYIRRQGRTAEKVLIR